MKKFTDNVKSTALTTGEWTAAREEAEFIAVYKGYDYNTAFKIAEERIRKAVNKVKS